MRFIVGAGSNPGTVKVVVIRMSDIEIQDDDGGGGGGGAAAYFSCCLAIVLSILEAMMVNAGGSILYTQDIVSATKRSLKYLEL